MKIKELFSDNSKWIKGHAAIDQYKEPVARCDSDKAVAWCLLGAIDKCYGEEARPIEEKIMAVIPVIDPEDFGSLGIISWNDAEDRTFQDIKKLVEDLDI